MPRVLPKFTVFVLFFFRFTKRILQKVSILQKPFYKRQSIALYFIFIFFRYSSNHPTKSNWKVSIGLFFKQSSYRKESVLQKKFRSTKSKKVSTGRGVFSFLSNRLTEEHLSYKKKFRSTKGKR